MNLNIEVIAVIVGLVINLLALLIAWGNVARQQTAHQVTQAERWATLTADIGHLRSDLQDSTKRNERDIQNLYQFHRELKDTVIQLAQSTPLQRANR